MYETMKKINSLIPFHIHSILLSFSRVCSRPVRIVVILIDQAIVAIVHPGNLLSACSVCEYMFCSYVWFEPHLTNFSIVLGYGLFEAQLGFDVSYVFIRMRVYERLLLSGHVMI
jgi:hypothetical protein